MTSIIRGSDNFDSAKPAIASTLKTAQESQTVGTSDTAFGSGLSATITPRCSGSYFKITVRGFVEVDFAWHIVCNIHRNGARINQGLNAGAGWHGLALPTQSYGAAGDNGSTPEIISFTTIDTTGSTANTPITFALVWSSDSTRTAYINRCFSAPQNNYETGTSEIIVEEIPQ